MKILSEAKYNELNNQLKAQQKMREDTEFKSALQVQELEFKLEDVLTKLQELHNMLNQPTSKNKCKAKVKEIMDFIKYNRKEKE